MTPSKTSNTFLNKLLLSIKESKKPNPDKVIIPTWVLVSFFNDYGVDELLIQPGLIYDGIEIIMMKNGKSLSNIKPITK